LWKGCGVSFNIFWRPKTGYRLSIETLIYRRVNFTEKEDL